MSDVLSGDDWKKENPVKKTLMISRHDAQVKIDNDFVFGRIGIQQWLKKTDELSEPLKWNKEGIIDENNRK